MVNFEWYRSFIAVYRAGTVTSAAAARFLTQPAISQHISALESAAGHALFQRTPRSMVPTEQGHALYSRMAPAMDGLERVSTGFRKNIATELPLMRLGAPLDYFYELGFEKLRGSQFRLRVKLGEAAKMIDSLSHGRLDAVIATQQIESSNIDYTKIDEEDFCVVAAVDINLSENHKKTLGQKDEIERLLLEKSWISYSEELPIIRRFWHVAFGRRPNVDPVLVVPSLLLIRKAVESGLGISVLPRYICRDSLSAGRLRILWEPEKAIVNELWLATRKVDRNQSEIEQLKAQMRNN